MTPAAARSKNPISFMLRRRLRYLLKSARMRRMTALTSFPPARSRPGIFPNTTAWLHARGSTVRPQW